MTCIVGIEDPKGAVVAGDSATTSGWHRTRSANAKVFRRDGLVIGTAGSVRVHQIVRYADRWEGPPEPTVEWMVRVFVAWYRAACAAGGVLQRESNVETVEEQLIVAINDRIFTVWGDFQVEPPTRGYAAVGSGAAYAVGAFAADARRPNITALQRARWALSAAVEHCANVSPPFTVERARIPRVKDVSGERV